MHIVILAARKGILLLCASLHPGGSLLQCRDIKKPSWQKLKMNRVHDDQETTETETISEEYTVHNVGRYSNDLVYIQMLIDGKR